MKQRLRLLAGAFTLALGLAATAAAALDQPPGLYQNEMVGIS